MALLTRGQEIRAKASTRIKSKAIRLAAEPALNFFDLANLLCDLHEIDGAALADLPALADMSRRRMYYLLQAGQLIREHQISRADAESIGWTKLQIIAQHLSQPERVGATLTEALALASATKNRDLPNALLGKRVVARRAVQFQLNTSARAELNEALIAHGAEPAKQGKGMVKREAALMRIVRAAMADKH